MATQVSWTGNAPDQDQLWQNPQNWDPFGVPGSGDTVIIVEAGQVQIGDLTIYNETISGGVSGLGGNILSLAKSNISAGEFNILTSQVVLDKLSFITGPNMTMTSGTINNDGILGNQVASNGISGAPGPMTITSPHLINTGQLVASNGGQLALNDTQVTGSSGAINVSSGGLLELTDSTIGSSQKVNLGGQTATTLAYDPGSSSINTAISGFDVTDFIHLEDFIGSVL